METTSPKDKLLFTPGPLTTSRGVKEALLRDLGSRDADFVRALHDVREGILEVAGVSREGGYEAVLLQGSGTFGVEAVLGSAVPKHGRLVILSNGAYGERMGAIARCLEIPYEILRFPEHTPVDPRSIEGSTATHVAVVHCETTSGILNPALEVAQRAHARGQVVIVDAMSSFGAIPLDLEKGGVSFLVASSNKCLEGVPGLSLVVARRDAIRACEGQARSLSLDLAAQFKGLEETGQFRFTPPTHVLLGLERALAELREEGGPGARRARYAENHAVLLSGMRELGFEEYLPRELQGPIITSFLYPDDPRFVFDEFYARLSRRGMVIYPGKVGSGDCFRIGTIGRLFQEDVRALLSAIHSVLGEMGLRPPLARRRAGEEAPLA